MKPKLNTVEDLIDYLIAEGETVMQNLRQMMEEDEGFDLSSLVASLAGKENEDETG